MPLSKRDWALLLSGLAGAAGGKKLLKDHPTIGSVLGAIAATYGADRLLDAMSPDITASASSIREALASYMKSPDFSAADKGVHEFFEELASDATPPELLAGFATNSIPNWVAICEAAEVEKSFERKMGETMALNKFVDRVKRMRAKKIYIDFWRDWNLQDTNARKATILSSVVNNADSAVLMTNEAERRNFGRMLDGQQGIDVVAEPDLRIYENVYACAKFIHSPETQGFYEIHRILVGNVEYRASR